MSRKQIFLLFLVIYFGFSSALSVSAEVSKGSSISSDNFRILDAQHSVFGGVASSSSAKFLLTATIGDLTIGSASTTNFGVRSGFLYYPRVVAPILNTATAGNSKVFLSWIPASASQGFSISGYNVCSKLTSGGTYSCENVGNVVSYEKSSLTNGSSYTFKIQGKDGLSNVIATSNEKSATPASSAVAEAFNHSVFTSTTSNTLTLTNSNGTTSVLDFPANFYSHDIQLAVNSFPNDYFSSSKPAPSAKNFIGKTYDFSVIHSSTGDQISTISLPATITIGYSSADISGFNESTLAPYRWGSSDSSWQAISGATINTTNKTVTFSTANFSSFALFGASKSTSTPTSSGGGGGGGGGGITTTTTSTGSGTVILNGTAYPNSIVNVYNNGVLSVSIKADASSKFDVKLENIPSGARTIGVNSEDANGRKSITTNFIVTVNSGAIVTLTDILLAPTIDISSYSLSRGDNIRIFGQTAPISEVDVHVASEETVTRTLSDSNGSYAVLFNTQPLQENEHTTKSRTVFEKVKSPFSRVLQFSLSGRSKFKTADLNKDGKVNITDFSILLYWWNTKQTKGLGIADISNDGKVNVVDFSAMLFQWTN